MGWIEAFRERENSVVETEACPGRLGQRHGDLTRVLRDTEGRGGRWQEASLEGPGTAKSGLVPGPAAVGAVREELRLLR